MSANDLCDDAGVFRETHYFAHRDGVFHPTETAMSRWGNASLGGPAVVGLAARCLEDAYGAEGFLPARLTADLFRAAHRVPTEVRTRLVRDGRRIRGSECDVIQDGIVVARAVMVQYRLSKPPPGREWMAEHSFTLPEGARGAEYFIGSDEGGWSSSGAQHQNASRKRVYRRVIDVVQDERPSPFVQTVVAAEAASLVTNLGTNGIGYINGDLTVALSRLPVGKFIGVQADSHLVAEGVSTGTATLFDDEGAYATGLVTAIANPASQIDFGVADDAAAESV